MTPLPRNIRATLEAIAFDGHPPYNPSTRDREELRKWLETNRTECGLARIDSDGTATGKTILTAPVVSARKDGEIGTMWAGPASTHVDLESGRRTPLAGATSERGRPLTPARYSLAVGREGDIIGRWPPSPMREDVVRVDYMPVDVAEHEAEELRAHIETAQGIHQKSLALEVAKRAVLLDGFHDIVSAVQHKSHSGRDFAAQLQEAALRIVQLELDPAARALLDEMQSLRVAAHDAGAKALELSDRLFAAEIECTRLECRAAELEADRVALSDALNTIIDVYGQTSPDAARVAGMALSEVNAPPADVQTEAPKVEAPTCGKCGGVKAWGDMGLPGALRCACAEPPKAADRDAELARLKGQLEAAVAALSPIADEDMGPARLEAANALKVMGIR